MINENFNKLSETYLFSQVSRIIRGRSDVINLSVGDARLPLPQVIADAGAKAASELSQAKTFRGYPPESGYDFFKQAVQDYYMRKGVALQKNEIFVSDGIKSDMATFLRVFGKVSVLLPSPCYPAYVDANVLHGNEISYYTDFPPPQRADVIIICSPSNPTGKSLSIAELSKWVDYAKKTESIILYDSAYEAFVSSDAPTSIYCIDGAKDCAVEFCSLSKTAGFTGVRCGYTVVPNECGLNKVYARLKSCLTNGVSYITQAMGACALTNGYEAIVANINYYRRNAAIMLEALGDVECSGGVDSPYIWLRCGDSWKEFHKLLDVYGLGVTPGVGFGQSGSKYVRINAFCYYDEAIEAAKRLKRYVFYR